MKIQIILRRRLLCTFSGMLPLSHQILELHQIQRILVLLLFDGVLNRILVRKNFLIQCFRRVCRIPWVEFPLLAHNFQPSVHVAELEVGAGVGADVPVLVDGRAQYYSLVE